MSIIFYDSKTIIANKNLEADLLSATLLEILYCAVDIDGGLVSVMKSVAVHPSGQKFIRSETVSDADNRLDKIFIMFQLFADSSNVYINGPVDHEYVFLPNLVQKIGPLKDTVGVRRQEGQQFKLFTR